MGTTMCFPAESPRPCPTPVKAPHRLPTMATQPRTEPRKRCHRRHSAPDVPHEIVAGRRNPQKSSHSTKPVRLEPIKGSPTRVNKSSSTTPRSSKMTAKVAIPRKAFAVVQALFKDYDRDGDGLISLDEFCAAVARQHDDDAALLSRQPRILSH